MESRASHVAVVGAGSVGATIAFATLTKGLAATVSLYDLDGPRARAEAADLAHGLEFVPSATIRGSDDLQICAGADVVVITAGAKQHPGESRLDLAVTNAAMIRSLVPDLLAVAPDALLLIVTNPVDVLTDVAVQVATEVAGLAPGRVFGSGTVLDSSRFRSLLAERCEVAVQNVHAYIVGEHGDSEFALWSSATIGSIGIADWVLPSGQPFTMTEQIEVASPVRDAAQQIIAGKGATNWAIGLATARILEAVLRDERRVLPVTAPVPGLLADGSDVCLSLPRIVGRSGCGPVLPTPLDDAERAGLTHSAEAIKRVVDRVSS
ncbi:L-lactate dehydrogenase [soil metagenome]